MGMKYCVHMGIKGDIGKERGRHFASMGNEILCAHGNKRCLQIRQKISCGFTSTHHQRTIHWMPDITQLWMNLN
jgi:hypothetical protein